MLDGGDVAGSGLGVPDKVAQGLTARAYIATDRPAYRPGQAVALRGIVREVKDGQYANVPGTVYRLEVADSRGRQIVARTVTLSAFGTFHETVPLDEGAPVGTYQVRLYQPGKSEFAGQFEVQAYQLEPIDLTIDLKKTVSTGARRSRPTSAPATSTAHRSRAGRSPSACPTAGPSAGTTDADGKYHVTFATDGLRRGAGATDRGPAARGQRRSGRRGRCWRSTGSASA